MRSNSHDVLRVAFNAIFSIVLSHSLCLSAGANELSSQLKVQALFLFNFANYVEWPADAFRGPESPLSMCLYGNIPFGRFLSSVDGSLIGQRRLQVIATQSREDIVDGCHLLFVSKDRKEELPLFFQHLKYAYVLSVGDQEGFSDKGGVISIFRTEDKLSFDINVANAVTQGLYMSSELLALAREVKRVNSLSDEADSLNEQKHPSQLHHK